jgi:Gpi18-like mannosyltransferase
MVLILILVVGAAIRLMLAPQFGGFRYDMDAFANWSWHLRHTPLDQFYAEAISADHLPGDLWFLWTLSRIYSLGGGVEFGSDSYHFLIKLVPVIADTAVAGLLFLIVRARRSDQVAIGTASLYLLNPATIYLTSVWGQWDSLSILLLLAALVVAIYQPRMWLSGVPLLAWGVLIKPPLFPTALLIIGYALWTTNGPWPWTRQIIVRTMVSLACGLLIGILTVWLLVRPFGLTLIDSSPGKSLRDRIDIALDLYPFKTMSASNIWMIEQRSLERLDDRSAILFGMSAHLIGNIGLIAVFGVMGIVVAYVFVKMPGVDRLAFVAWCSLVVNLAIFLLPTRIHERYLFPALVCSVLVVGLSCFDNWSLLAASILSCSFFTNLAIVYGGFKRHLAPELQTFLLTDLLVWLALANLVVWWLVIFVAHHTWSGLTSADERSGTPSHSTSIAQVSD